MYINDEVSVDRLDAVVGSDRHPTEARNQ